MELGYCEEFSKLDIILQTPKPYRELSTKKVLVLEYIEGVSLSKLINKKINSLLIGMFWVNTLQPGVGLKLGNVDVSTATEVVEKTVGFSSQNFIEHIIPKSIVEAMATNEILQIVIFSIFFGLAAASIGNHAKPVVNALDKTSHIILKMINSI